MLAFGYAGRLVRWKHTYVMLAFGYASKIGALEAQSGFISALDVMLACGYAGKAVALEALIGFIFGMGGCSCILEVILVSKDSGVPGGAPRFKKAFSEAAAHYLYMHSTWCKRPGSPESTGM